MLFFPYRFDLELARLPVITILISILCVVIYFLQFRNEVEFFDKTLAHCGNSRTAIERMAMNKSLGGSTVADCFEFVTQMTIAEDSKSLLNDYVEGSKKFAGLSAQDSKDYVRDVLTREYASYKSAVPPLKTKQLWYHPSSWDPVTMLTSNFAHGSWAHVIGNLFFFFAFAAAVELIIGSLSFAMVVLLMSFGTSISYSLVMASANDPLPTVGLSGVVMGMMALLTYFWPSGKIRCFWWFLIFFGTVAVPAWLLALFYIGFDVYHLLSAEELGPVNLVAHVSGAAIGLILGMTWFRRRRRTVHEITD